MNPSNVLARMAMVALALLAAACGGGGEGGDTAPTGQVQVDSSRMARATVGAAGGTVSATAVDGRVYALRIPAGALAADTEITATPVTSMGDAPLASGLRAGVRFGPAGLRFGFDATLRIEGARITTAAGKQLVAFLRSTDGSALQLLPHRISGTGIELPVPHFSDAAVSEAPLLEIPLVPLAPAVADTARENLWNEFERARPALLTRQDEANFFIRVFDSTIEPLLRDAASSTSADAREAAIAAFSALTDLIRDSGVDAAQMNTLMGDRLTRGRAAAGALLKADLDAGLAACAAPAPASSSQRLAGLNRMDVAHTQASFYGLAAADLSTDAETVKRRMNECVRVVFVPKPLPAFEVARQVSLDQQAALAFAAEPTAELPENFSFVVAGTDAQVARASGFGSTQGEFTTLVTPSTTKPLFETRACWMARLPNDALVQSLLCATQTLGGDRAIVLSGEFSFFSQGARIGGGSLTLRFDREGQFTVLEALGASSKTVSGVIDSCRPFPADGRPEVRNIPFTSTSSSSITRGEQATFLAGGRFIVISLFGRTDISNDEIQLDCSVLTRTVTTENAGAIELQVIELGADGLPSAIVLGDTPNVEGRLVRRP